MGNNAGFRPAKECVIFISLHGLAAFALSIMLAGATGLLFAGFFIHYWMSSLPPSRWFAASAAMLISALILGLIVFGNEMMWWFIDDQALDALSVNWIALTLVAGVFVGVFFPHLRDQLHRPRPR